MLAYAADRRPAARPHPKTLMLILAGHAGLLFAVMTARGDLAVRNPFDPTEVTLVPVDPPPPPPPADPQPTQPADSHIFTPDPPLPLPLPDSTGPIETGPPLGDPGPLVGTGPVPTPDPIPVPLPDPAPVARVAAKSLTPASDLTPPYPDEKRRLGEEAVIRLRLDIDPRGRVVSVSPLGAADAAFVEAARRHILKRWRYRPATENGAAVATTQTVSIRFRMDG